MIIIHIDGEAYSPPGTRPKYLIQTGRSPAEAGLRSLDPVSSAPGGTIKAGHADPEGHQLWRATMVKSMLVTVKHLLTWTAPPATPAK